MILLTSDGLSSDVLFNKVKDIVKSNDYQKAVIVVTADKRFKKKSESAHVLLEQFENMKMTVQLFDFGDDTKVLETADVIIFDGGNPFYLLLKLKEYKMEKVLKQHLKEGKFIIGVSGGSLVLQKSLKLIDVFAADMNMRHGGDLKGMGLIDIEILPHKTRYQENFDNFDKRYLDYKNTNKDIKTYLIEDGEGLLIHDIIEEIKEG